MPSTLIRSTGYDAATQTLSVWFVTTDNRYDYQNVPPETYEAFRQAFAKGRFFNLFIRGRYRYELIEDSPSERLL